MKRFWDKVEVRGPDECWPWLAGGKSEGYGRFQLNGRLGHSHRIAYELAVGPIPPGLDIDHTCHNDSDCPGGKSCPHRACCNPAHLEPVTRGENIRRGNTGAHERDKTHCPRGHAYAGENLRIVPKTGQRQCRACARESDRRYKARQRNPLTASNKGV